MGVKGLQGFAEYSSSDVCVRVNLKTLANRYKASNPGCTPTIVVDAMGCIRSWYTPNSWVHGGQWKEHLSSLQNFIEAFNKADIRLVFIFDGVVEQKKRMEWVKRRLQDNHKVSKIFNFLKSNRQQPGKNMFFIPSGLSTFTRYALKFLGQEVFCSRVEGDYEVAEYGLQHRCLGILGCDSDYLIFNTVPYFCINKLLLNSMDTIMYSREGLCRELGLSLTDLPLLSCLLGNDLIPENEMAGLHRRCTELYPCSKSANNTSKSGLIRAVAAFISSLSQSPQKMSKVQNMLHPGFDLTLIRKGIESYVLPQQCSPWLSPEPESAAGPNAIELSMCKDREIVQIAMDEHHKGLNNMICNVLCTGETECSNTLEDDTDTQIPGQALIYKPARQHIYAILLGTGNGSQDSCPMVKEWYVYPGNRLQEPDLVPAVPLSMPGGMPSIRHLWLSDGLEVQEQRYYTCLACFHAEGCAQELREQKTPVAAVCCLLIYLALQVESLRLNDLEAFLAQVLCLEGKTAADLRRLQLPYVDSRGVHLAFVFLRGLVTLMGANSACWYPFNMLELMPWNTFDGKLFHQKYLQCHQGYSVEEILEHNTPLIAQFTKLRTIICDACAAKGRNLQVTRNEHEPVPDRSSCSFKSGQQSQVCPPYGYHRRKEWDNASRQQAHYSDEYVSGGHSAYGDRGHNRPYQGFPPYQRPRRRGQRTRGHPFAYQCP
ncbi:constitutive coactivator of peroxisome proliferator-activated receptor gamma isoform 2-T2 [Discoglossus pictus]